MVEGEHQPKTVRQLRQERGWTQLELAWRLGVEQASVSLWESGRVVPRLRHQQRLAKVFGIEVTDIAFRAAEQVPRDKPQSRQTGPDEGLP